MIISQVLSTVTNDFLFHFLLFIKNKRMKWKDLRVRKSFHGERELTDMLVRSFKERLTSQ